MANQKEIRTRIVSVKNTQKITRAMKMVAGARLNRAQTRIQELRPYARETASVLRSAVNQGGNESAEGHPLLAVREQKRVLLLVVTSDRGLCGAFNSSILRRVETLFKELEGAGKMVKIFVIGRKGRDFLTRRKAPLGEYFGGVWDELGLSQARRVAHTILKPYVAEEVDEIRLVYNEFKSAMTQTVTDETLFPLQVSGEEEEAGAHMTGEAGYIFEPDKKSLLDVLVPMYIEVTLLRALYESMASELGARMTAMDSATKNASDMIDSLTLQYNRARQAAITTELMEIIGGAEALKA